MKIDSAYSTMIKANVKNINTLQVLNETTWYKMTFYATQSHIYERLARSVTPTGIPKIDSSLVRGRVYFEYSRGSHESRGNLTGM